jgi:hypothetical protein
MPAPNPNEIMEALNVDLKTWIKIRKEAKRKFYAVGANKQVTASQGWTVVDRMSQTRAYEMVSFSSGTES